MKQRIDVLLTNRGYFESRAKASVALVDGAVEVDGKIVVKPSFLVEQDCVIKILKQTERYVSRGGYKLEEAINKFKTDFSDKVVLDIGASTGGWTDCALKHGAKKVYAVDVGTSQLHARLKQNKNVISLEKCNALCLEQSIFDEADIIVCDVSFTSGLNLFDNLYEKISSQKIVWLLKPQFECGKELAKKYRGILDEKVSEKVKQECLNKAKENYNILGVTLSPIKGGDGNTEFLVLMQKKGVSLL